MLLRIAHGDILSNERLTRFGLANSAACNNCQEPRETIEHKFVKCQKANDIWQMINSLMPDNWEDEMERLSIRKVLGLEGDLNRLQLTVCAEVLTRINSQGGKPYDTRNIVISSLHTILNCETLQRDESLQLENCLMGIT